MTGGLVRAEVRSIDSADLAPPALPPEPTDCDVTLRLLIGPAGGSGTPDAERFRLRVVTPRRLLRRGEACWGRGLLIVPQFDWAEVAAAIADLLAGSAAPSWREVVETLSRELGPDVSESGPADA